LAYYGLAEAEKVDVMVEESWALCSLTFRSNYRNEKNYHSTAKRGELNKEATSARGSVRTVVSIPSGLDFTGR
jgi:hypothetical protein